MTPEQFNQLIGYLQTIVSLLFTLCFMAGVLIGVTIFKR